MPGPLLMVNPRRRRKGRSRGPGRPRGPGGRFKRSPARKSRRRNILPGRSSFAPAVKRKYKKFMTKSGTLRKGVSEKLRKSPEYKSLKQMSKGFEKYGTWRKKTGARKTTKRAGVRKTPKRRKYKKPAIKSPQWKFGKGYITKKRKKATTKRRKATTKRRKSSKRARAARKAWRTRKAAMAGKTKRTYKRRKATTKRRTTKRRKRSRSRIMKTVWRKRKQGSYRRPRKGKRAYRKLYRTKTGRPFKRARRVGKSGRRTKRFQLWKNQTKDFFMTAGIAAIGAIAAAFLVKQLHEKVLSKNASTAKLNVSSISVIAGAAGAFLLFKYGNKLTKNKNLIYGLSMGLAFFSAITVMREYLIPQLPADLKSKLGLGGYVLGGYVHAPMRGYVHSNVRGYLTAPRSIAPGSMGALRDIGVGPAASFDTATEGNERQYDKFRWQGVFSKSVFEN